MRILLIEDDKETAFTIRDQLYDHFAVDIALNGGKGVRKAHEGEYDLIIIDFILPDLNGIEVCQKLRKDGIQAPVLILTGENRVETKVDALNAGADDYLTKPFKVPELLARIHALMRRPPIAFPSEILSVGDLTLDLSQQIARRKDRTIFLRRKEFQLLEYFMRNKGRTITREMILEHVWGTNDSTTNLVDVHVNYLRNRVDRHFRKKLIRTVRGLGYKLEA